MEILFLFISLLSASEEKIVRDTFLFSSLSELTYMESLSGKNSIFLIEKSSSCKVEPHLLIEYFSPQEYKDIKHYVGLLTKGFFGEKIKMPPKKSRFNKRDVYSFIIGVKEFKNPRTLKQQTIEVDEYYTVINTLDNKGFYSIRYTVCVEMDKKKVQKMLDRILKNFKPLK